jgi:hypothetical protein
MKTRRLQPYILIVRTNVTALLNRFTCLQYLPGLLDTCRGDPPQPMLGLVSRTDLSNGTSLVNIPNIRRLHF